MPIIEALATVGAVAGEVAVKAGEVVVETAAKVGEAVEKGAEVVAEAAEKIPEKVAEGVESAKADAEELSKLDLDGLKKSGQEIIQSKMESIRNLSPKQLDEITNRVMENAEDKTENAEPETDKDVEKTKGLTDEEKAKIKEETGWSDEIIDAIGSMEEYDIYKKAGLLEAEIGGKKCLIRTDIDWDQTDAFGNTNRERAEKGLAPLDKNGKPLQLHHIGQHADSPLAELTFEEHRCGGNDTILHDKNKETEVHGEGNKWDSERSDYWKARGEDERSQS